MEVIVLIAGLMIMILTMVYVVLRRRDELSLHFFLLSFSLLLMFVGVMTTLAKSGGLDASMQRFLFITRRIQLFLQTLPIPATKIGFTVAIGRTLFPFFLLQAALECTMVTRIRRLRRWITYGALIPTVLFLLYYYPPLFRLITHNHFGVVKTLIYLSRGWIAGLVLVSLGLFVYEYLSITMRQCRRDFSMIILGVIGITLLYGLYAIQDPAQIYNLFITEYLDLNSLSYFNRSLRNYGFLAAVSFYVFFLLLGPIGIVSYTSAHYLEHRVDRLLKRKFDARSVGIAVFAHSMKNQLIASQILTKRIARRLAEGDVTEAQEQLERQADLQRDMLEALNLFYKSLNDSRVHLQPVCTQEIVQAVRDRVEHARPEGVQVFYEEEVQAVLLGDLNRLVDALMQLIRNAWEAQASQITLRVKRERLYYVFSVEDNGRGLTRRQRRALFEPFHTTKSQSSNWGLGLYFVRNTLRSHYGRVQVSSEPGQGSQFVLVLPKYLERTDLHDPKAAAKDCRLRR